MLAIKRLAGVVIEVDLREHTSHTPLTSANKAAHAEFESQRRHHRKSTTGFHEEKLTGILPLFHHSRTCLCCQSLPPGHLCIARYLL